MKTIKVFLASSEELEMERLQFDSLFNHLNRIFRPRGLYLELSMWEYLDKNMDKLFIILRYQTRCVLIKHKYIATLVSGFDYGIFCQVSERLLFVIWKITI